VVNAPVEEDPRFERLPKWIKSHLLARGERIIRLEQELAAARSLLNEGPEDAAVVVDPYSANRQPLHGNPTIEFRWKPKGEKFWSYFLVRLEEDRRLEIHASSSLVIHPSSGNAVRAEVVGR
jgi:hypothetical protein